MTANEDQPLVAKGKRLEWDALPLHIVQTIDIALGDPIVETTTIHGGYSPGIACIARTFGGQEFFIKAACSVPNEQAPEFHRREVQIATHFDPRVPAPKLVWSFDEGAPGWVVLIYEVIHGRNPQVPWVPHEVDLVIDALNQLAVSLTPSPVSDAIVGRLPEGMMYGETNFGTLAANPPATLDAWTRSNLDKLVDLEQQAVEAVKGDTLVHLDIRGDNLLITDERVVVVDWPHARIGAAWVDAITFAPSLAMQGGPDPESFISRIEACRNAEPDAITAGIAELAGFFTSHGSRPPVDGLPGLREFQEAQGAVARQWLAQRTGWH